MVSVSVAVDRLLITKYVYTKGIIMNTCCNNIYPSEDMNRWESCPSTMLANADNYYTKSEIDEKLEDISISGGGITSGEVQTQIDASVESLEGSVEALSGAVEQLSSDLENKADKSDIPSLDNYYDKDEVNTIIEDNEYTISQAINDLNDRKLDASAYTPVDLSDYYTKQETQEAINAATSGTPSSATIERLRTDVNALSGDVSNLYETKLDASAYTPTDLSQYWTSAQTQSAIDDAISGITGGTGVTVDPTLDSGSTNAVANSAITNALDAKADASNVYTIAETNYLINGLSSNVYSKTEVNNLVSNKANVWCGDETSFNALTTKDANTIYLVY